MAQFRNSSSETVVDHLTQQMAEPDHVITVEDEIAENYQDHPIWTPVADFRKTKRLSKDESAAAQQTTEGDLSQ